MVDLSNSENQCTHEDNNPAPVYASTGGLIANQFPLICGGRNTIDVPRQVLLKSATNRKKLQATATDACFVSGQDNQIVVKMSEARAGAASVVINNKLWITGGNNGSDSIISTTEYIVLGASGTNGISLPGPDLPVGLTGHSMVLLNETACMIIAGDDGSNGNIGQTYIYDSEWAYWKKGPNINSRKNHGSAKIIDSGNNIE